MHTQFIHDHRLDCSITSATKEDRRLIQIDLLPGSLTVERQSRVKSFHTVLITAGKEQTIVCEEEV
jgi:hypothetical protein